MHSWEQKRSRGNLGKGETADRRWDAALYSLCGADISAWGRSSGRDQRGSRNKDSVSVGHWSKSHHLFQSCFVSLFGQEGGKLNGESAPNTTDSPSPSNFSSHLVISSNLHMDWSIVPLNVWSAWLGLLCYSDRHFELGLSSGFCWWWLHQSSDCNFVFSSLPALFFSVDAQEQLLVCLTAAFWPIKTLVVPSEFKHREQRGYFSSNAVDKLVPGQYLV